MKLHRSLRPAFIAVLLAAGTVLPARAEPAGPSTGPQGSAAGNELLLAAATPFEDLIEYALDGNREGVQRAVADWDRQAAGASAQLSPDAVRDLEGILSSLRRSLEDGADDLVAMRAVEAYRILIGALDPAHLKVPLEVALLDYVGFKMTVLLHAQTPDWLQIRQTAEEGAQDWGAIASQVRDPGLRDAVNTAIDGMSRAVASRNGEMAGFAAQVDLALVDLLEGYFESH